jgi:hypothetical protein
MTDLDCETTAAVEALAYRIRQRDADIHAAADDLPDAEVFARDLMTMLRGRGWRPTEARAAADWRIRGGAPAYGPAAAARARELYPNLRHPDRQDGAA